MESALRLCEGFWLYPVIKHALCNDSERQVTAISAKHLSMPFETVSIAVIIGPIMTGTIVTLRNFKILFNSRLRPVLLLLLLLLFLLLVLLLFITIIIIYDRIS